MGELLSLVFGNAFAVIVDICNTGFYFCVMMCYQVIATQYIIGMTSDLAGDKFDTTLAECYGGKAAGIFCKWHYIILYLVVLCLNVPLILPKSVAFLNKISSLTVISAIITTGVVMIKGIIAGAKGVSSNGMGEENIPSFTGKLWPKGFMEFFTMAPFITANFQIHSSFPPLFVGTKNMSKKVKLHALNGGSYVSNVICSALFLIMAVSGAVSFDNVSSNVLNDFSSKKGNVDVAIVICRVLMTIVVVISYPALMFPTAAGLVRYFPKNWKITQLWNGRAVILIVRLGLTVLITLVSTFVTDIGVIFSVASALFSIVVVYIGPMSIMMLWPRIEKLGKPDFRKLSVVDNLIYNKVVDGNQYFTMKDVIEKTGIENVDELIVKIDPKVTGENEVEMKEEKKEEDKIKEIQMEGNSNIALYEIEYIEGNAPPQTKVNELMQYKDKLCKLPPAPIPTYRYVLYGIAMVLCVIMCILSIVGTIMEQFK